MLKQIKVGKPYRLMTVPRAAGINSHIHDYIKHPKYAEDPRHYVAAIRLIENDLRTIFEYVEPADKNSATFSHRIHQLLFRSCVEIEAHFRNILSSNQYELPERPNMNDYRLIEQTHALSDYQIRYPGWRGKKNKWTPFKHWVSSAPSWWSSYNGSKHDRHSNFEVASLQNLMAAVSALIVLYHSQYRDESFLSRHGTLGLSSGGYDTDDGMDTAIMRPFRIAYPDEASYRIIYDFDWEAIKHTDEPVAKYNYNQHRKQ